MDARIIIAKRVAQELRDGNVVNLGIGIPTLVANYIPQGVNITLTSENGIVGLGGEPAAGEEDFDLINAGGGLITAIPSSVYVDSAMSFAIVRGGHLDITVLGALQVDQAGNIANWMIPGKLVPGMGGAMDLLVGAKRVIVATTHTEKSGGAKILKACTLPLTAKGRVSLIVTEKAVIEITKEGAVLREVHESSSVEEVQRLTDANLILPAQIKTFA